MTTKQNAIVLARTARSEAANTAKRTISAIISNWNECVKQAGFTGIFDFPTTGYTRKTQLIADLERCAAQLDDYVEPVAHPDNYTVEQQTREINAALTRVLDSDEAHAEALVIDATIQQDAFENSDEIGQQWLIEEAHKEAQEMNADYQAAIATIAENLTLPVWEGCSETVKREIIKHHHTEALKINDAYNSAYTRPGAIFQEAFFELLDNIEREVSIDRAHTEALIVDARFYKECA